MARINWGDSIRLLMVAWLKKHYKKSDFVLVKSLIPCHGQVTKASRSISHWLVSLLASHIRQMVNSTLILKDVTPTHFSTQAMERNGKKDAVFARRIFL